MAWIHSVAGKKEVFVWMKRGFLFDTSGVESEIKGILNLLLSFSPVFILCFCVWLFGLCHSNSCLRVKGSGQSLLF